jgi:6-phosphofructokinase 1
MIRSVPANAADSIYAMILAQNAVHGAMAGYTGFTSGMVNNRTVMIPMDLIVKTSPTNLQPEGRTWERVIRITHQQERDPYSLKRTSSADILAVASSGSQ